MVDTLQIAAAVAGFGPAMALLFFTLRDYTYPKVEKPYFDDRKLFAFFALGIVLGMVVFAFENWGSSLASQYTVLGLVLGFAVMEELMKLVILNFPRFQRKIDTAFYGLSLGLGIAATYTFATVYVFLLDAGSVTAAELAIVSAMGIMFVLLHGATTTMIGIGVSRGDLKGYLPEAVLIHIGFGLMYESFFAYELVPPPLNLVGLGGAAAIVVYAYNKIHRLSLPVLIKDAKKLAFQRPRKIPKV